MNLKQFSERLTTRQRSRFLRLAGTTQNYLWQLLGGHRQPSLRLLIAMREASKAMFPRDHTRWLTVGRMHMEFEEAQERKTAAQAGAA